MRINAISPKPTTKLVKFGVFILFLGLILTVSFPANALQPLKLKETQTPELKINYLSPYVVANNSISLEIESNAPADSVLYFDLLTKRTTRSQLNSFTQNIGETSKIVSSTQIPLSNFADPGAPGIYKISIPINSPDSKISLSDVGVYPISISITSPSKKNSDAEFSFLTYVPNVSENGSAYSQKLNVVPLLTFSPFIDRNQLSTNDKESKKLITTSIAKFNQAKQSIEAAVSSSANTSLLLSPEALDNAAFLGTLGSDDELAGLFPTSAGSNFELIQDTYVPMNIAELEKAKLNSTFVDSLTFGRNTATSLGYATQPRMLASQSITKSSIETINKAGIERAIVEDNVFNKNSVPSQRHAVIKNGEYNLKVAASETDFVNNMPKSLSASSKANYLLAATSIIEIESPSVLRGTILPIDLELFPTAAISQFLQAASDNPLIKTVSTKQFFADIPEDKALSKKLSKAQLPVNKVQQIDVNEIKSITKIANATESIYEPASIFFKNAQWTNMVIQSRSDRKVLKSVTKESANFQLEKLSKQIDLPEKRTLTLTSREEEIPVTIRNNSGEKLNVVIELVSDKLAFPKGDRFPISLTQENTTLEIPVKSRTAGSFPIVIRIYSPEERLLLGKQGATVKSTVISGVGAAISIASILFLLLWWILHTRKASKKAIAPVIDLKAEKRV